MEKSRSGETPTVVCAEFLDALLADYSKRDFQVRLWDGTTWGAENHPRFTLVLNHPGALRAMFLSPSELTLGEAYIDDDYDIEGDIEAAFDLADYLLGQERSLWRSLDLTVMLQRLPAVASPRTGLHLTKFSGLVHSKDRDREAIRHHYNLPAEFYALWLDRRMIYSCAYFANPEDDLDTAQVRKLDYICRKLRLRRGERLLDIGCGWGGLIMHAAAHYGVEALGITLSEPQAELAQKRLHESELSDRCRVVVCDYRDLGLNQQYDKIVSVGMFEHVGEKLLPEYFRRTCTLLRPGGVFLNHGIAYSANYHRRGPSFTDRYVFPDGELLPISTSLRAAELSGFEVRDVESLREHYALTLHHWVQRLEARAEEARRITGDTTYRIWRLYMAGAAHGFRTGRLNLYQTLFARPQRGDGGLPLTREDWYRV
ncbi:MAG TPA: cyclopropane-fatty-acyl-phospholipid synthase family protein [Candidatus Acidoferrales bacterium]|nr:cyclopropane-fatty-acyl-phospholipid synthase family protein [Candidatus Acidoferrales bacterium]